MNASDARDESLFAARGFGQRIGFGDRPALLVIDIIRAFTDPESPLGSDLDAETAAIRRVAAAASKNGAPIIYSTIAYRDPECRDGGIMIRKSKGAVTLREGTSCDREGGRTAEGACEQLASGNSRVHPGFLSARCVAVKSGLTLKAVNESAWCRPS